MTICRKDPYGFFAEPVPVAEVRGYLDVIKSPMDFGTIRQRINSGSHYKDVESFVDDMNLVCNNAMKFNPPESPYHQAADRIQQWMERAVARETENVILPREEEEVNAEEERRRLEEERNLAMGLKADGRRRRKKWKKGGVNEVPEHYIPAALKFLGGTTPDTSSAGGTGVGTPNHASTSRGTREHSANASRSETPAATARKRKSRSPSKLNDSFAGSPTSVGPDDGDDSGEDDATPGGRFRLKSVAARARSLKSRGSIVRGRNSQGVRAKLTVEAVGSRDDTEALPLSYLPDGSIDPNEVEDVTMLLSLSDEKYLLSIPTLESVVPISHELAPSEKAVPQRRNNVQALEAALLTEPGPLTETYSHDTSGLPPLQQHFPFQLPTKAAGPWECVLELDRHGAEPLRWPLKPQPPKNAGYKSKAQTPAGPSKDSDWTFSHGQPRLRRLLAMTDVGTLGTVVPARAIDESGLLSQFHYLHDQSYRQAMIDEMTQMPVHALKAPPDANVPVVPQDLTHLIWTNMYRSYKPQLSEVLQAGARAAAVLRAAVWGDTSGEAYARSVAAFVEGAAKGVEERLGPELEETAPDDAQPPNTPEREHDIGLPPASAPTSTPKRDCSEPLEEDEEAHATKRVKMEVEDEDEDLPTESPEEEEEVEPSMLDRPLMQWVRDNIIDSLSNGQLSILNRIADGFALAGSEEDFGQLKASLFSDDDKSADDGRAASEVPDDLLRELDQALLQEHEHARAEGEGEDGPVSVDVAVLVAASFIDPQARMRRQELLRVYNSRIDLSEFRIPVTDLATDTAEEGPVVDPETGERLVAFPSIVSITRQRVEKAFEQYGDLLKVISSRARESERAELMAALKKSYLRLCLELVDDREMVSVPPDCAAFVHARRNPTPAFNSLKAFPIADTPPISASNGAT